MIGTIDPIGVRPAPSPTCFNQTHLGTSCSGSHDSVAMPATYLTWLDDFYMFVLSRFHIVCILLLLYSLVSLHCIVLICVGRPSETSCDNSRAVSNR